jgi:tetratricopeptide (TPR) repeat protein
VKEIFPLEKLWRVASMKRRLLVFFIVIALMVAMPIIIFPLNATLEDAQFNLAVELYEYGRYEDSIVEFDRLLKEMHTEKYVDAGYFYRGNAYLALEDYATAREQFLALLDNFPESTYFEESLYLLGRSEYLLGHFKPAISRFDSYVSRYPAFDYADNSLYWKAESLLSLGSREEARGVLKELLERYPLGNKSDAARFKLKLMEIEDELARKETPPPDESGRGEAEEAQWHAKEQQYQLDIERLNNQIQRLRAEIDALQLLGEKAGEEDESQLEERMRALIAWENILKIKEESLNQKELQLDQEFERIQRLSNELERFDYE